jgi:hypothetical protein
MHSEISGLLSQLDQSYNIGLKNILTELYDNPPYYERKLKKEAILITRPYLCILGASTIDWLVEMLKENDLRSGFLARFLYISVNSRGNSKPMPPPPDIMLKDKLIIELKELQNNLIGEVTFSDDALTDYVAWYERQQKELDVHPKKDLLSSFYVRLMDYCIKIAILYAINDHKVKIEKSHFSMSSQIVEYLKLNIEYCIEKEFTFTWIEKQKKRVLGIIQRSPEIKYRKLLQNSKGIKGRQLKEIVSDLEEAGEISDVGDKSYVSNVS